MNIENIANRHPENSERYYPEPNETNIKELSSKKAEILTIRAK